MTDTFLIVILAAIFILVVIVWLNKQKMRRQYLCDIATLQQKNDQLILQNKMLESNMQQVFELESKLNSLVEENKNLKKIKEERLLKDHIEAQEPKKIFYMVKPIENYFPAELKSDNAEGTVYEISIDKDNEKAGTFIVHTKGAQPQEIIRRSEMYLKPGCIEQNPADKESKKIITEQPGIVQLEDEKWVIKEKAIIRYE